MDNREFKGKKFTVIGLARSGVAAAKLLKESGAAVFGSDSGEPDPKYLAELTGAGIPYEVKGHGPRALDASVLVLSPGVPLMAPVLQDAKKRNIPVWSEIELAFRCTDADIVGITGSNGKTTTTALAGALLKPGPFQVRVGGNIGTALSGLVTGMEKGDVLVAELSSFQLDTLHAFRPRAAAVLNLTPDHIDRYPSEDAYYAAKLRITQNQVAGDLLVLNEDDPNTLRLKKGLITRARILGFSLEKTLPAGAFVRRGRIILRDGTRETDLLAVEELALPGRHNLANALAAVALVSPYPVPAEALVETLRKFSGIEHRIEFVREKNGVRFYNDSKGTNVDAVRWALLAMKGRVNLIAGGRDKAGDFTSLNPVLTERVKAVYLIGEAADKMEAAWKDVAPLFRMPGMEEAVSAAYDNSERGDNVLLSPGCASFDMYKNYEERGRHFKQIAEEM
ncbi:MAG: UDP-N-acetylmuramoyl-L-alanine--D-glutamate ligase [Fibrobacterota bacterium]